MYNKTLIGCLFVLFLFMLIPSISAIQQRTIEDIDIIDDIKHPILYEFVYLIYSHREMRINRILNIAVESGFMYFEVRFPILYLWGIWLGLSTMTWLNFWKVTSNNLGWGWFEEY